MLLFFLKNEWDKCRSCFHDFQTELACQIVAERCGADFGNGEAARRNDKCRGAKLERAGAHYEFRVVLNLLDVGVQKNFDASFAAFGFQHICDVLRASIAEELAEGLLVIRDAMLFDEGDEIGRGVAGERGFREVRVGAEEILGAAMEVRKVAAAAPGNENFLADAVGTFEDGDAAPALAGFERAEKSRGAGAEDENIKFVR